MHACIVRNRSASHANHPHQSQKVSQPLRFQSLLRGAAAAALLFSATIGISNANQPFPSPVLIAKDVNLKALVAGGTSSVDLGDLSATQYYTVTATDMRGATATTLSFRSPGGPNRQALIHNGETIIINNGSVVGGDGELLAYLYPSMPVTNVTLTIRALAGYDR